MPDPVVESPAWGLFTALFAGSEDQAEAPGGRLAEALRSAESTWSKSSVADLHATLAARAPAAPGGAAVAVAVPANETVQLSSVLPRSPQRHEGPH